MNGVLDLIHGMKLHYDKYNGDAPAVQPKKKAKRQAA